MCFQKAVECTLEELKTIGLRVFREKIPHMDQHVSVLLTPAQRVLGVRDLQAKLICFKFVFVAG